MVATVPGNYGSAHLLFTFHGGLPGGEAWSVGLRTEAATPDPAILPAYALVVTKIFEQTLWHPTAGTGIFSLNAPGTTYQGVTLRALNIAGVTTTQVEQGATNPDETPGGAQSAPDQIALVISLHTAVAGRHGKGRIYVPATQAQVLSTGRMSTAFTLGLAKSAARCIWDLGPADGTTVSSTGVVKESNMFAIAVQSRTSHLPGPPVNGTRVGDVLDTMRRRRVKLKEVYSAGVVSATGA